MTNEQFMQRAQLQKANAEYVRREQVKDWFLAAFVGFTFYFGLGLVVFLGVVQLVMR